MWLGRKGRQWVARERFSQSLEFDTWALSVLFEVSGGTREMEIAKFNQWWGVNLTEIYSIHVWKC